MIRPAIIRLGRWGQNLVTSVRNSTVIRFSTAPGHRLRSGIHVFC